jgi:hypothetical protein
MIPLYLAGGGLGLQQNEAEFADVGIISELNETGRLSIDRARADEKLVGPDGPYWRFAAGIYRRSSDEGGGYCGCHPWFLTIEESFWKQGLTGSDNMEYKAEKGGLVVVPEDEKFEPRRAFTTGVLHPNVFGHCHYADEILSAPEWKGGGREVCDTTSWAVPRDPVE